MRNEVGLNYRFLYFQWNKCYYMSVPRVQQNNERKGIQMVRMNNKHYEYQEFLLCSYKQELRNALLCPDKMRERDRNRAMK